MKRAVLMPRTWPSVARPQRGQALLEFLVGAVALVALLAAIVVTARLQDVQWATISASRYAAFEHAMRGSRLAAADLQGHVRSRFFEPADVPLRTADVRRDDARWRAVVANWTDRSPRANALVERPADVVLATGEADPPGAAARLASTVATLADRAALAAGGRFDVNRRGYVSAEVAVRIAPLVSEAAPLSRLNLVLRERTTVLGDSWASSGPEQVAERAAAFVPTAPLRALRPVLGALRWALRLFEPAFDSLCLGRIDPELVPVDRLGAPGTGERGQWVAAC